VNSVIDPPFHKKPGETAIAFLPFFHIFGLATLHYTLLYGTRAVCMQRFDLQVYLEVAIDILSICTNIFHFRQLNDIGVDFPTWSRRFVSCWPNHRLLISTT
jgi:acyl-CoA synthetase (AMP-forming)/AMP-acid ligase II